MSHPGGFPRRSHGSRRLAGAAGLAFFMMLHAGCRSLSDPDSAPAVGTFGGMAAGVAIGSLSGNAANGAVIGGMLGRGGGEVLKSERSPSRALVDHLTLQDFPAILREAGRFDNAVAKEYHELAKRRAINPGPDTLVVKAQSKQRLPEIKDWIVHLEECDRILGRAIADGTRNHRPDLGDLLSLRNQLHPKIRSLKDHQSWFKTLAS